MLVSDLIYAGFRIANILLAPQRGPSNPDTFDGLAVLNSMLDAWLAERLTVYAEVRSIFPLTANKQFYAIGLSGSPDWNIQRPERIERAGAIYTYTNPATEVPLRILSDQEWASVTPKEEPSPVATMLYYQAFVPNGQVTIWPIPSDTSQVSQVAIYTWDQIPQFANAGVTVNLPPAYQEAIEYGLAVRLAARYGRRANISDWSVRQAGIALKRLKTMNAQVLYMQTERANRGVRNAGRYNPISNSYFT